MRAVQTRNTRVSVIKAIVGMMIKESGGGGLAAKEETVFYRCVYSRDAWCVSVVCCVP